MNVHAMLGSVVTAMLTFTAVAVANNIINPVILDIGKIELVRPTIEPIIIPTKDIINSNIEMHVSLHVNKQDLECMATNMYFEARDQTDSAMAAVGYTVLNRVTAKRYHNTVCGVVYEGRKRAGAYVRGKCQFSWVCDGTSNVVNPTNVIDQRAWERSLTIAHQVLSRTIDNPIGNATMYHATYVSPYWASSYDVVAQLDDHIFYEKKI